MAKRCFLCGAKMDENTGLCTNPDCVRSKPLPDPKEKTDGSGPNKDCIAYKGSDSNQTTTKEG